ncbi:hypothetical protein [Paraburkholderia caballeronis]|uniref:Uncharacterized protein n=1 Tax=Paraburkholderia caballeronis TaxID=416943 RepID=A0A1H7L1G0_9BURK|nr:hypothetical protein [Paraburkholderia caballeronis]PXW28248.1 hypothetical protein C7403_102140 [Paraburkholderia caballeronis]PXX03614.1 hypothetical protein C7407_102140 [Paraburkholderia caballeronis]RAK04358.1 hypothetical protein C7409_102140 [Paraburkholderia caballeronis]SED83352.1 hypothetical protein SAMN05445871_4039 [Paraburkholderia caballeronis]SEK92674.1 hypothetical protein SAMN05192542_104140 [Paraburkholderia caballeronis]
MNHVTQAYSYRHVSASGNIRAGDGVLGGIFVSAATGTPTIAIYDDAADGVGTLLVDEFTPTPGQWIPLPFAFVNGLNIVIGGTVSATVGFTAG